jgi:hypothetical protein
MPQLLVRDDSPANITDAAIAYNFCPQVGFRYRHSRAARAAE